MFIRCLLYVILCVPLFASAVDGPSGDHAEKRIAYLVSDERISFWEIMARGINRAAQEAGYQVSVYSAHNEARKELENTVAALKANVDGIIVSPTTSSACVTILSFAKKAGIPVVISDIGTDAGEYLTFISSDNFNGAYELGLKLALKLQTLGWHAGGVGIVAIPQKRLNGQLRTAGFIKALKEEGIDSVGLFQQKDFSYSETYQFSKRLIEENPSMRAIWLQGSDRYQAALDAIRDTGKESEILLVTFDAEPEFIQLIQDEVLVGAAMQQPYLMGETAVKSLQQYFLGETVKTDQKLNVLTVTSDNINDQLETIKRNVLGIEK